MRIWVDSGKHYCANFLAHTNSSIKPISVGIIIWEKQHMDELKKVLFITGVVKVFLINK